MTIDYARSVRPRSRIADLLAAVAGATVIVGGVVLLVLATGPGGSRPVGKRWVTEQCLNSVAAGLERFRVDMGRYPTTNEGLDVLIAAPQAGAASWHGPYVSDAGALYDAWGNRCLYQRREGLGREYLLYSPGADQRAGTADDVQIER